MDRIELKNALRDHRGVAVREILQELFDIARELDAEYTDERKAAGEEWRIPSPYFGLVHGLQHSLRDWAAS